MVFSSYEFLLIFFPLVLTGFYLLAHVPNGRYHKLFLLGASLFFYGYYHLGYLLLILVSVCVNYLFAVIIQHRPVDDKWLRRTLLTIGVLFNVGLIGYYKYFNFFLSVVKDITDTEVVLRQILLPLGISFFTFQQLSFLISVYKREETVGSFLNYCLFVTFFPQLVAGPIVLYGEMIPQFADENKRHFNVDNFAAGMFFLSCGLFKKTVIADTLALFVDNGFAMNSMGLIGGWITSLSYTFQIYFDFSGYSDMAIGLGKFFNIELPDNFDKPYLSESLTVFWRRWHMTLGRALSTYIYKPLGGNRKGNVRTCMNLFLTFLVSGPWHGASWTFLVWGAVQGIIVILERLCKDMLQRIPHTIRISATFLTTNFLWVLFRADSFKSAGKVYKAMLNFRDFGFSNITALAQDGIVTFPAIIYGTCIFVLLGALFAVVFRGIERIKCYPENGRSVKQAMIAAVCFALSLLCMGRESVFIYFNF